jgi:hypothetical protein
MKTIGVVTTVLLLASMALLYGQSGGQKTESPPFPPPTFAPQPAPPGISNTNFVPPAFLGSANREPAPALPKVNAAILEKAFHLKLTKQKIEKTELVLIFEFTKTLEDVDKVRLAFQTPLEADHDKGKSEKPKIYLFDEDNVVVEIKPVGKTSGIITGRVGDAFRLHLSAVIENPAAAIRKIEFRSDVELPVARTREQAARELAQARPMAVPDLPPPVDALGLPPVSKDPPPVPAPPAAPY